MFNFDCSETRTEVRPYRVKAFHLDVHSEEYCNGELIYAGRSFHQTHKSFHDHVCQKCKKMVMLAKQYPYIEYKELK